MGTTPRVVVIGAGFGGIGVAIGLRADGADVTVLEQRDGIGGTWRANTYPGATCDIPSHLYSYSFAPRADWSRVYAPQAEILAYLEQVVDDHDLRPHVRTGVTVVGAAWHEDSCTWTVELDTGGTLVCDVLVAATGQLSRPLVPDVPGLDAFPGPVLHSAWWDHDVDLDGARVGVVGSGASAIQFLPPVARVAAHTTLFQRTPSWVLARHDAEIPALARAAFAHVPGVRAAYRFAIWAWKEASWVAFREGHPANRLLHRVAEARLRQRVADPDLRDRLRPDFTAGCKRMLVSDEWYEALQRDDVTVVDAAVARVEGSTVVGADGSRADVDAVLLGTGFAATDLLVPVRVTGRGGQELHEVWSDGAEAHLGMTVAGFPNLFVLYGPNTNLAHNSIVYMLESQFRYVRDAVRRIAAGEADAFDVRAAVQDRFNATLERRLEDLVWDAGCSSWYLTGSGRNTLNWPGPALEYRLRTRRFEPAEHEALHAVAARSDVVVEGV